MTEEKNPYIQQDNHLCQGSTSYIAHGAILSSLEPGDLGSISAKGAVLLVQRPDSREKWWQNW